MTLEDQALFVQWLKDNHLYNSMESAANMVRMHTVWKAARLDKLIKLADQWEKPGNKYERQAKTTHKDAASEDRLFALADTYIGCASDLKRILKDD